MSNIQAFGYFLDYCNNHADTPGMQEKFNETYNKILGSPEGRFDHCHDVQAVLKEIGWK